MDGIDDELAKIDDRIQSETLKLATLSGVTRELAKARLVRADATLARLKRRSAQASRLTKESEDVFERLPRPFPDDITREAAEKRVRSAEIIRVTTEQRAVDAEDLLTFVETEFQSFLAVFRLPTHTVPSPGLTVVSQPRSARTIDWNRLVRYRPHVSGLTADVVIYAFTGGKGVEWDGILTVKDVPLAMFPTWGLTNTGEPRPAYIITFYGNQVYGVGKRKLTIDEAQRENIGGARLLLPDRLKKAGKSTTDVTNYGLGFDIDGVGHGSYHPDPTTSLPAGKRAMAYQTTPFGDEDDRHTFVVVVEDRRGIETIAIMPEATA